MKNQVIIDYLSFTVKNNNEFELVGQAKELHQMLESFCKSNCSPLNEYIGGHMYTKGYISFDGFRTYYGGKDTGNTLFVQISGSGCILLDRYFDGGLLGFLMYILRYSPKITRLDLAADEIGEADYCDDYCLDPERIEYYKDHCLLTGSARKIAINCPRSFTGKRLSGFTAYIGSRKSDAFIRIYDKKVEQHINGSGHWMRCELELHDNKAREAFILLTSCDDYFVKIKQLYTGICLDTVRFIEERKSNITRSKTASWWTEFLDGCEVGFKFTQEKEYKTIDKLMNWVDHSVLGTLNVVYETYGFEYLFKLMRQFVKDGRLSASHMRMIEEFNREEQRLCDERFECTRFISSGTETPQQFTGNIEVL